MKTSGLQEGLRSKFLFVWSKRQLVQSCSNSILDGQRAGQFDRYGLNLSSQFMIPTNGGDELPTGPDFTVWVFGVMGDASLGGLKLTAGYTLNGSQDDSQTPYGNWSGYKGMIIEELHRAEEQTLLLGAAYEFHHPGVDGLSFTALAPIDTHVADDLPLWD